MRIEQSIWSAGTGWSERVAGPQRLASALADEAQLVLVFGSRQQFEEPRGLEEAFRRWPAAHFFGCSTAGVIQDVHSLDGGMLCTAVAFEGVSVAGAREGIPEDQDDRALGRRLATSLEPHGLVHVLVLSDGLRINGTELVAGLRQVLPPHVALTGGLAADGPRFEKTYVLSDREVHTGKVALVGLYGEGLSVGCGSGSGWDPFGPERVITRSEGNVLFELDGRSALDLYKRYLGEDSAGLPATGLLFPLTLRRLDREASVVRTILGVDDVAGSMTFAGDMPEGGTARLMRANLDRLIDGSLEAARVARQSGGGDEAELALLISCVGRKMVLKQRVEEEVDGARAALGERPVLAGFYSYGEISPHGRRSVCELHNQTMTITTLRESPVELAPSGHSGPKAPPGSTH